MPDPRSKHRKMFNGFTEHLSERSVNVRKESINAHSNRVYHYPKAPYYFGIDKTLDCHPQMYQIFVLDGFFNARNICRDSNNDPFEISGVTWPVAEAYLLGRIESLCQDREI